MTPLDAQRHLPNVDQCETHKLNTAARPSVVHSHSDPPREQRTKARIGNLGWDEPASVLTTRAEEVLRES